MPARTAVLSRPTGRRLKQLATTTPPTTRGHLTVYETACLCFYCNVFIFEVAQFSFQFRRWLWHEHIEHLSLAITCYTVFTHVRQFLDFMAWVVPLVGGGFRKEGAGGEILQTAGRQKNTMLHGR